MADRPDFTLARKADGAVIRLSGAWSALQADLVEPVAERMKQAHSGGALLIDLSGISSFDTLGAIVLQRVLDAWALSGRAASMAGANESVAALLAEIKLIPHSEVIKSPENKAIGIIADIGESVVVAGHDFVGSTGFFGQVILALGKLLLVPRKIRWTSIVAQLEHVGFRGVPIIMLISFLVGAIVAQQGIFQLSRFGASTFAVNLIGILVLRELGVLLTSIMVAGRSGSAFTAELGSMTMREEVDALRVMGLDPIEILVIPRLIALIAALPLLTFVADLSALFGGGVVSWLYAGMASDVYLERLKDAISLKTIFAGLIKAPFMALVIALIACGDGLSVKGSAESLGRKVTDAVVKSIFMVIVVDGIFAMFFAAIRF
jgi:phospholipid/cholesterol/gamma-HCH transport system permease protein